MARKNEFGRRCSVCAVSYQSTALNGDGYPRRSGSSPLGVGRRAAKRRDDDRRRRVWVERSCHRKARVGTRCAGAENRLRIGGAGGHKGKLLPRRSVPDLFNASRISRPIHNTCLACPRSADCTKILWSNSVRLAD